MMYQYVNFFFYSNSHSEKYLSHIVFQIGIQKLVVFINKVDQADDEMIELVSETWY